MRQLYPIMACVREFEICENPIQIGQQLNTLEDELDVPTKTFHGDIGTNCNSTIYLRNDCRREYWEQGLDNIKIRIVVRQRDITDAYKGELYTEIHLCHYSVKHVSKTLIIKVMETILKFIENRKTPYAVFENYGEFNQPAHFEGFRVLMVDRLVNPEMNQYMDSLNQQFKNIKKPNDPINTELVLVSTATGEIINPEDLPRWNSWNVLGNGKLGEAQFFTYNHNGLQLSRILEPEFRGPQKEKLHHIHRYYIDVGKGGETYVYYKNRIELEKFIKLLANNTNLVEDVILIIMEYLSCGPPAKDFHTVDYSVMRGIGCN